MIDPRKRPICKACGFNLVTSGRSLCNDCIAVELGGSRPSLDPDPSSTVPRIFRWIKSVFAVCVLLLCPPPAHATLLWDWTGSCVTGCAGTASLHVSTTDAYVPGTVLNSDLGFPVILLDATYHDSELAFDMARQGPQIDLLFELPASNGAGMATIISASQHFTSNPNGTWRFSGETPLRPDCAPIGFFWCPELATGTGGTWTLDPVVIVWPATWLLLAAGALALWKAR